MDDIIPTLYKSKLPHTLSYPLGAKAISYALVGVPQFNDMEITFRVSVFHTRHHGTATAYQVVEVRYWGPMKSFSASKWMLEKDLQSPRWRIEVDAVPRSLRHVVHDKLVTDALPAIRAWLTAYPHSAGREGRHSLAFLFDEPKVELITREQSSVEWQTIRETGDG